MIHRARFQNFKALRDVEVTFDSRLTVLVGPNGSGKTSVLQGIDNILNSSDRGHRGATPFDLGFVEGVLDDFYSRGTSDPLVLEVGMGHQEDSRYTVRMTATRRKGSIKPPERRWSIDREYATWNGQLPPNWDTLFAVAMIPDLEAIWPDARLLHLDAVALALPSVPTSIDFDLQADGTGFASYLAGMHLSQLGRFRSLVNLLRSVIPSVADIHIKRVQVQQTERIQVTINGQPLLHNQLVERLADVLVFDFTGAPGVPASHVSEGTLLVLGILAAAQAYQLRSVILLDDLDHGLHPKAQMDLVGVLRKLLEQFPDLQIIATSHSPFILDRLQPNEVRVTALQDDGSAVCKPLTDHPDFERWKESMSPGEFWSTFYEDWLTKTRTPQPVP